MRVVSQLLRPMFSLLSILLAALQLENPALHHHLGVLHRPVKRPKLTAVDGLFWARMCMVPVAFFTVPTIRFQVRYGFLVNVTAHPTAEWTAQQLRETLPFEQIPRHLLQDRDSIFGSKFWKDVRAMGIREALSAPRSPWQRAG